MYRATVNLDDSIGVAEDDDTPHRLVCRRDEGGQWHPLFAVSKTTDERVELPSCFSPRKEVIEALRDAWNVAYKAHVTTPVREINYPISPDDLEFVANEVAARAELREVYPDLWDGSAPGEAKRLRALAAHMRLHVLHAQAGV